MESVKKVIAGVCAAAAIGTLGATATTVTAGTAQAAQVVQSRGYVMVWLTVSETKQAAHMGLANFLNQPVVRAHSTVSVERDSVYQPINVPGKGSLIHTTPQLLVNEAAAHRGGRAGIGVHTGRPDKPITIAQYWP
ncbi:hypothetical protein L5I01_20970 [Gordonia sp. HY442]|uniref:hypothetical protein n=1 Tax=Gordonia zhenghanii TaxID=2911516 RepID=UPI001F2B0251|nr:hypothetical protein [Gordonia zhenghanii]MCF8605831.1 hypothetical protein [Gordonia zhenghanii]